MIAGHDGVWPWTMASLVEWSLPWPPRMAVTRKSGTPGAGPAEGGNRVLVVADVQGDHGRRRCRLEGAAVTEITLILDFLAFAERLKRELRHSWLSDGRRESVAEHTFQMALMALLMSPHLEHPVDLARTLKLVLAHDLVEAEAGDVPYLRPAPARRRRPWPSRPRSSGSGPCCRSPTGAELHALWHEFEAGHTPEARFARALDHLEVQVQHNLAPLDTWLPLEHELVYTKMDASCGHDRFLRAFCAAVRNQAESKLQAGGVDVIALRTRLGLGAPA